MNIRSTQKTYMPFYNTNFMFKISICKYSVTIIIKNSLVKSNRSESCVKMSKRCQIVKKDVKMSNTWTRKEVHKNNTMMFTHNNVNFDIT